MPPETLDTILKYAAIRWGITQAQAKTEYDNHQIIITEYPVQDLFLKSQRTGYLVQSTLGRQDFIIIIDE